MNLRFIESFFIFTEAWNECTIFLIFGRTICLNSFFLSFGQISHFDLAFKKLISLSHFHIKTLRSVRIFFFFGVSFPILRTLVKNIRFSNEASFYGQIERCVAEFSESTSVFDILIKTDRKKSKSYLFFSKRRFQPKKKRETIDEKKSYINLFSSYDHMSKPTLFVTLDENPCSTLPHVCEADVMWFRF